MRTCLLALVFIAGCGADATMNTPAPDLRVVFPTGCMSGDQDGDETDVDCGGSCPGCEAAKACKKGKDCASGLCTNRVCDPPKCDDGMKNGAESDQDCGGTCPGCALGELCNEGADCASMTCTNGMCAPSPCEDGKQDGAETDIDCGGVLCGPCDGGRMCTDGADCKSGVCTNNVCKSALMCMLGMEDCDGDAGNGCEVDTRLDVRNCGSCGHACGAGTPNCVGGKCLKGDFRSCQSIVDAHASIGSGVYTIDPDGAGGRAPFKIYCEMDTDGGGWDVQAYLRQANQWDWAFYSDNGMVGDKVGGFSSSQTLKIADSSYTDKIVIFLNLVEEGASLGKQWMVVRRADNMPIKYSTIEGTPTGWSYRDSYGVIDGNAGNVCTHGCAKFRTHGMLHDESGLNWHGTQGLDLGCRDGNNICWADRGLGCNVGSKRCAYLSGNGEGVIYGVRNK